MDKALTGRDVEALGKARMGGRDRLVALCAADYTDLALGLGETRLAMSVFACSSANVSLAHEKASRMGHAAAGLEVEGKCGEDFARLLGMAGSSWSRRLGWKYRFLSVAGVPMGDSELGLFYAQGDLGRSVADARGGAEQLRAIMDMYGVESAAATKTMLITAETGSLAHPSRHPMFWSWVGACVESAR